MIFKNIFIRMFLCRCYLNSGVRDIKQLGNDRLVGRCLRCGKRVYGRILFDPKDIKL